MYTAPVIEFEKTETESFDDALKRSKILTLSTSEWVGATVLYYIKTQRRRGSKSSSASSSADGTSTKKTDRYLALIQKKDPLTQANTIIYLAQVVVRPGGGVEIKHPFELAGLKAIDNVDVLGPSLFYSESDGPDLAIAKSDNAGALPCALGAAHVHASVERPARHESAELLRERADALLVKRHGHDRRHERWLLHTVSMPACPTPAGPTAHFTNALAVATMTGARTTFASKCGRMAWAMAQTFASRRVRTLIGARRRSLAMRMRARSAAFRIGA